MTHALANEVLTGWWFHRGDKLCSDTIQGIDACAFWGALANSFYGVAFVTDVIFAVPRAKQFAAWGAVRRMGKREALRRLELLG